MCFIQQVDKTIEAKRETIDSLVCTGLWIIRKHFVKGSLWVVKLIVLINLKEYFIYSHY